MSASATEAPADLAQALADCPDAQRRWERLPPSHRREWLKHLDEAKRPETRARRLAKAIETLAAEA